MTDNRFEKNPLIAYAIITTFTLLVIEFISYFIVNIDSFTQSQKPLITNEIAERHNLDFQKLKDDNKAIYNDTLQFHPYRWYKLKENFKGSYITLDQHGFRNSQSEKIKADSLIGFFGGSTAFSIFTNDDHTIPVLLEQQLNKRFSIYNYGVGAYNSTSELMTFIEVIRSQNLKYAIFYDGVNEVGRHVEAYERGKLFKNSQFKNIGHFHEDMTRVGIENSYGYKILTNPYKPNILKAIDKYVFPAKTQSSSRKRLTSLSANVNDETFHELSKEIINTYINNVKMISAVAEEYGITPIFLWQPEIYTTRKELSEYERKHFNKYAGIKKLTN